MICWSGSRLLPALAVSDAPLSGAAFWHCSAMLSLRIASHRVALIRLAFAAQGNSSLWIAIAPQFCALPLLSAAALRLCCPPHFRAVPLRCRALLCLRIAQLCHDLHFRCHASLFIASALLRISRLFRCSAWRFRAIPLLRGAMLSVQILRSAHRLDATPLRSFAPFLHGLCQRQKDFFGIRGRALHDDLHRCAPPLQAERNRGLLCSSGTTWF